MCLELLNPQRLDLFMERDLLLLGILETLIFDVGVGGDGGGIGVVGDGGGIGVGGDGGSDGGDGVGGSGDGDNGRNGLPQFIPTLNTEE